MEINSLDNAATNIAWVSAGASIFRAAALTASGMSSLKEFSPLIKAASFVESSSFIKGTRVLGAISGGFMAASVLQKAYAAQSFDTLTRSDWYALGSGICSTLVFAHPAFEMGSMIFDAMGSAEIDGGLKSYFVSNAVMMVLLGLNAKQYQSLGGKIDNAFQSLQFSPYALATPHGLQFPTAPLMPPALAMTTSATAGADLSRALHLSDQFNHIHWTNSQVPPNQMLKLRDILYHEQDLKDKYVVALDSDGRAFEVYVEKIIGDAVQVIPARVDPLLMNGTQYQRIVQRSKLRCYPPGPGYRSVKDINDLGKSGIHVEDGVSETITIDSLGFAYPSRYDFRINIQQPDGTIASVQIQNVYTSQVWVPNLKLKTDADVSAGSHQYTETRLFYPQADAYQITSEGGVFGKYGYRRSEEPIPNEDSANMFEHNEILYGIVADGAGGYGGTGILFANGTRASTLLAIKSHEDSTPIDLGNLMKEVNQTVYQNINIQKNPQYGCSTLSLISIDTNRMITGAIVGDSLPCVLRDGDVVQELIPQNVPGNAVSNGLPLKWLYTASNKNYIDNSIGATASIRRPSSFEIQGQIGDVVVNASDGLVDFLSPEDMAALWQIYPDPQKFARALYYLASERAMARSYRMIVAGKIEEIDNNWPGLLDNITLQVFQLK